MGRENYLCRRRLDEAVAGAGDRLPGPDRAAGARLALRPRAARRGRRLGAALRRHHGPAGPRRDRPRAARPRRRLPGRALRQARSVRLAAGARRGALGPPRLRQPRPAAHRRRHPAALRRPDRRRSPPAARRSRLDLHGARRRARPSTTCSPRRAAATGAARSRAVARTAAAKAPADVAAGLVRAADGFEHAARVLPGLADDLGAALEGLVAAAAPDAEAAAAELYGRTLLLTAGLQEQSLFDGFASACGALAEALSGLAQAASAAAEALPEEHRERPRAVAVGVDAAAAARLLTDVTRPPPRRPRALGRARPAALRVGARRPSGAPLVAQPGAALAGADRARSGSGTSCAAACS